jgi:hypothetical protein
VIVATPADAFSAAGAEHAEVLAWHTDRAGEVREFALQLADGRDATGRVLTRVPVYRVIRKEVVVKVTFGTALVACASNSSRDANAGVQSAGGPDANAARVGSPDANAASADAIDGGTLALFERIEIVSSGETSG